MKNSVQGKMVLFGAGKIGRSFIGQLFSRGGYEVVFIDISEPIIDALNRQGNYNVVIRGEREDILHIKNVRGVVATDEKKVADEIATAGILAVSVGSYGLPSTISLIAKGLLKRFETNREVPLDIIIAENLRNGAEFFREKLMAQLPDWYPIDILVGLVETSIGKMVPIMTEKDAENDILQVFAEPYNTLILDKVAFRNPIPDVEGLAPKENMKAWVDRKLFIHNLGHACAAYCGYFNYPDLTYMYEVLAHDEVMDFTRTAMLQSSKILDALYPGVFTESELQKHIEDLIFRFRNKELGDTVFRVGCDLERKLGADDRMIAPLHAGVRLKLSVDKIAEAIFFGLFFRAKDENGSRHKGDVIFIERIAKEGLWEVMQNVGRMDDTEYKILLKQFVKHKRSAKIIF